MDAAWRDEIVLGLLERGLRLERLGDWPGSAPCRRGSGAGSAGSAGAWASVP